MKCFDRSCWLLIVGLLFAYSGLGQSKAIESILNLAPQQVERLKPATANQVRLEVPFNQSELDPKALDASWAKRKVSTIQLVYSANLENRSYAQRSLNRQRLRALYKHYPQWFENPKIWSVTAVKSAQRKNDFHGFIISFQPESEDLPEEESPSKLPSRPLTYADSVLGDIFQSKSERRIASGEAKSGDRMPQYKRGILDLHEYLAESVQYPDKFKKKGIKGTVFINFYINPNGKVTGAKVTRGVDPELDRWVYRALIEMPDWTPEVRDGKPAYSTLQIPIQFTPEKEHVIPGPLYYFPPNSKHVEVIWGQDSPFTFATEFLGDSTVLNSLERHPEWVDMLIVCDFTSSMYPYLAQVLVWHQLQLKQNQGKARHFTFFNDGDFKADRLKRIGDTGGVYHTEGQDFEAVKNLAALTMQNGLGGFDVPENNLEALLSGMELCKDCGEIIMIADNDATPRDMVLMKKVKKPVRIIVCGAFDGINPEYLNLARKTKGSVHTMESDLTNLIDMSEGEEFELGNFIYKIENGNFVRLDKL